LLKITANEKTIIPLNIKAKKIKILLPKIKASEKIIKLPRIKAKKKIKIKKTKIYEQLLKIRINEKIKISSRARIKIKKMAVILPPSVRARKTKIIN